MPQVKETVKTDAARFLETVRKEVDDGLDHFLPKEDASPETLHKAMRYSVFAGGKRLRPALVLAACEAVGGKISDGLPAACAVEMIHTYSLIHDDLPAMDDDDLRRGRPTCHKVFGEAFAILAGDALLTIAFETIAKTPRPDAIGPLVLVFAQRAGCQGMVGGQVLDIEGEGKKPTLEMVRAIHSWKTAALIASCCEGGALAGGGSKEDARVLREFGEKIGLAFQILDDILDITKSSQELGKTAGKDLDAQKATYPAVLSIDGAQKEAQILVDSAMADLDKHFSNRGGGKTLKELARFVIERTH